LTQRPDLIEIARRWKGTPYHHQASLFGVGCDCLGLVRGVYRDATGTEPAKPPPYNPSWAEISSKDDLLDAAFKYLVNDPNKTLIPGNVAVFKMFPRSASKHCGIISYNGMMIHSYDPHGVVETTLNQDWIDKIKAVFKFPFVSD
jgi:NlpC/P60 family putative phage cell wall peptidase